MSSLSGDWAGLAKVFAHDRRRGLPVTRRVHGTDTKFLPVCFDVYIASSAAPISESTSRSNGVSPSDADAVRHLVSRRVRFDMCPDPFTGEHTLGLGSVVEQRRELIAAEPKCATPTADDGGDCAYDDFKALVALLMSERIVHRVESIEIDEDQRHRHTELKLASDSVLQVLLLLEFGAFRIGRTTSCVRHAIVISHPTAS